jgi:ATP-dependent Zn protease
VDSYIIFARTETRAILSTYASAVIAIANALVEHRTLNSSQIESIVKATTIQ